MERLSKITGKNNFRILVVKRNWKCNFETEKQRVSLSLFIYSVLHILTIVFPDTRNVKYLPIFYC